MYLEVSHFRSENIFLRIPSSRIPRQVGRLQISRSCDFFKARYPPAGHFYAFIFVSKKPVFTSL